MYLNSEKNQSQSLLHMGTGVIKVFLSVLLDLKLGVRLG